MKCKLRSTIMACILLIISILQPITASATNNDQLDVVTITSELQQGSSITIALTADTSIQGYIDLNGNQQPDTGEYLYVNGTPTTMEWGTNKEANIYAKDIQIVHINDAELTSIDINQAPKVFMIDLTNNHLKSLTLTQHKAIKHIYVGKNQINKIELSDLPALNKIMCANNPQLTQIQLTNTAALQELFAQNCALSDVDLSQLSELLYVSLNNNHITKLNISQASKLVNVNVALNNISAQAMHELIESLNNTNASMKAIFAINTDPNGSRLGNNVCLKDDVAMARDKGWSVMDDYTFSNYEGSEAVASTETFSFTPTYSTPSTFTINLTGEDLWIDLNRNNTKDDNELYNSKEQKFQLPDGLEPINVYGKSIVTINADQLSLSALDLTEARSLESLSAKQNKLTEVLLPQSSQLRSINLIENQLTSLDLSSYTHLTKAYLNDNKLIELTLGDKIELIELNIAHNQLKTLDLLNAPSMLQLIANSNLFNNIQVSGLTELKELNLNFNQLTELDLFYCTKLNTLKAKENKIASVRLPIECPAIQIDLSHNLIEQIDIAAFTKATAINLSHNQLSAIEFEPNESLIQLSLSANKFNRIDVTPLTKLQHLYISQNELDDLDLEGLKDLCTLSIFRNKINGKRMHSLIRTLNSTERNNIDKQLIVVYQDQQGNINDTNIIYQDDVAEARARKWNVCSMNDLGSVSDYAGIDPKGIDPVSQQTINYNVCITQQGWIIELAQPVEIRAYSLNGTCLHKANAQTKCHILTPERQAIIMIGQSTLIKVTR